MHSLLSSERFLGFVSDALVSLGRGKLTPGGPHRDIITVRPDDRTLQILAGPGSGKTEMLVWRVLYDLCVLGTPSERIMVTTFTRRAATELSVRVVERCDLLLQLAHRAGVPLDDPKVHNLRIGTIHSLCDSLLAEFDTAYMEAGTQLIDEPECVARMARAHRLELSRYGKSNLIARLTTPPELVTLFHPGWVTWRWPGSQMERVDFLLALINQQIETWFPRCGTTGTPNGIEAVHVAVAGVSKDIEELRTRWEKYLDDNQILDFATVQKRFLSAQPGILDKLSHVFVDEFQDNNPIQFAIHTSWLANPALRLTVVGDDDQALYRFRGSDLECFADLEKHCNLHGVTYRQAKLEENHRSTKAIVDFSQAFRSTSVLHKTSMAKHVKEGPGAQPGEAIRLLTGPWNDLCQVVAEELAAAGCGTPPAGGKEPPTGAVLMFSTSERSAESPALALRTTIAGKRVTVYNPRNKTAAEKGSPVYELLGLISYLIDPVRKAPVGAGKRSIEVAASMHDPAKVAAARSAPPADAQGKQFPISEAHLTYQKGFIKADGKIGSPGPGTAPLLEYLDAIRDELANAWAAAAKGGRQPRLTLAGLVARLLSFDRYKNSGFTEKLFRQALFTGLLEAHTAPSRRTMLPLDAPLKVESRGGKYVWDARYWNFLNVFGSYLDNANLDDPEVEAFEEDAVLLLTFHQAKGLEFDHVYVAGTGRTPDAGPALRTELFSGRAAKYAVRADGSLFCQDARVAQLAEADREREVYVAVTRAKKRLTVLFDPDHNREFLTLNPTIERLFAKAPGKKHPTVRTVEVREFTP